MKLLCAILMLVSIFAGEKNMYNLDSINDYFEHSNAVVVYSNGNIESFKDNSDEYKITVDLFEDICTCSREMPAYGVSLNEETQKELTKGFWVEFVFDKTQMHNGMPFDSLLIQVQPHFQGFDLIRGQKGVYEGRCFHIYSPHNTMENLYNYLLSL